MPPPTATVSTTGLENTGDRMVGDVLGYMHVIQFKGFGQEMGELEVVNNF
jgi:hypothetical protein